MTPPGSAQKTRIEDECVQRPDGTDNPNQPRYQACQHRENQISELDRTLEAIDMARLSSIGKFDVVVSACGIEQPYLPGNLLRCRLRGMRAPGVAVDRSAVAKFY